MVKVASHKIVNYPANSNQSFPQEKNPQNGWPSPQLLVLYIGLGALGLVPDVS